MDTHTLLCTDTERCEQTHRVLTGLLEAFISFQIAKVFKRRNSLSFSTNQARRKSEWVEGWEILCEMESDSQDSPSIRVVMGRSHFNINR